MRAGISELETGASEYQQNEWALRKSEQRFRRNFEHSNDAIFIVDHTHRAARHGPANTLLPIIGICV